MKRQNQLLALTMLAVLTAPASSFANDPDTRQVWRDTEGQVVLNTYGNCVRSIWENGVDVCGPPPPVVAYHPPAPRTIIAEADRTVYFPFNVATLTPESQQRLDTLAARINSASDVQDAQVVGFADRIGTTSYNEALSKKRAEGVRDYLITRGVVTENDTITRWVGKTESNTQCPPNLSHEQLIECLAPDRKVTVELKYKTQEVTQPQTNAAPYPQDQSGQYTTGQNPQDWTGQSQSPAPPLTVYTTGDNEPVYAPPPIVPDVTQASAPMDQPSYAAGQTGPAYVAAPAPPVADATSQPQPETAQMGGAQAEPPAVPDQANSTIAPEQPELNSTPSSSGTVMGTSGQSIQPTIETFTPPRPTTDEQDTDAQPYIGQPPLPSVAETHYSINRQYAMQDVPQVSDEYRYRYLTTGE